MNIFIITVEIMIMLLVFGFLVFGLLFINPISFISDYPPEIQDAYFKSQKKEKTKEKLTVIMKIRAG